MQEDFLKKLIESKNDPYAPRIENLMNYMKVESHENFLLKIYGDDFYDLSNDDMFDLYMMIQTEHISVLDKIFKERRELIDEPFGPVSSCDKYFDVICDVVKKEGDLLLLLYCLLKKNNALLFL